MTISIYQQIRSEGYRDGAGQAGMICYDDAYYKGQQAAWAEAPSRRAWFTFGVVIGQASIALLWWLS